ncbi:DUF2516 family protein [Corynebacterium lizhenjunii]|uniref:DUF2516 family protein n=2 Tax=Corynebacterium lizhenjunii TaxID=2709394 RepID=A0A7T0KGK5_9CORY|nr:DUF2516 family protein [Corynebacterium lizhenjunii]QPK79383.1 DUF2516 family protein [Corynebacterium lizhenjunii]
MYGLLTMVNLLHIGLYWAIALAGLVGAGLAATTRPDAFEAADRKPKWVWVALLVGSAAVLSLPGFTLFSWVGAVIIGIYWFDVRPQISNLLRGYGY